MYKVSYDLRRPTQPIFTTIRDRSYIEELLRLHGLSRTPIPIEIEDGEFSIFN